MPEDFLDFEDSELDRLTTAFVATDVSMTAMSDGMSYFISMLMLAMEKLKDYTGLTMNELREQLESELELQGSLEHSMKQMLASRDIVQDVIEKMNLEED